MILTIIIFILVLGLIVLVHEWGHYISARKNGVAVEEFGFGFPPRAAKLFKNKHGTWFTLNWLPVGGFVKLKGEQGDNTTDEDSFARKPAWRRAIILSAGVGMNILLAVVIFAIGFTIGLPKAVDSVPQRYASISEPELQIVQVVSESPAFRAGLEPGDVILSVGGEAIETAQDIRRIAQQSPENELEVSYTRGEEIQTISMTPEILSIDTSQPTFGISTVETGVVSYPFWYAIWMGIRETAQLLWLIISALVTLIIGLFTSAPVSQDLVGPVGVAVITGKFVELGFIYLLQFIALISLNLAIINIIPFPALDGGRLLFLFIEKIKGSPVNQRIEAVIHNVGFIILLILVGIVTVRDLFNIEKLTNLF